MSAYPFCLGAVPYEAKAEKPLIMCLYVDTEDKEIPNDFSEAAYEQFANYEVEFYDFHKAHKWPSGKIFTPNSLSEKEREEKLSEVNEAIEKSFHLFENRLNVTAIQASFKVVDFIEQEERCVRVFVFEQGRIPAGETPFPETVEGIDVDVAEGYYQPACGDDSTNDMSPLRGGSEISVSGKFYLGTLGGFLKDEENHYIISCQHVLSDLNVDSIVHPVTGNSRLIANYVDGLEGLIEEKYWIDVAIAKLKPEEVRKIKSDSINYAHCSLYGFETHDNFNGEIGNFNGLPLKVKITKIGAKTGRTDSASCLAMKIKNRERRYRVPWFSEQNSIIAFKYNESFCKKGDSGSLFFGDDGRAWGVFFGIYNAGHTMYCLAAPLSKCLETLKTKTGKKNLHLWLV